MLSQNKERLLARLKSGRARAKEGLFVVEGIRGVEEALDGGADIRFALCSSRLEFTPRGRALAERLEAADWESLWLEEETLDQVAHTETPQGIVLVVREPPTVLEDLQGGRVLALDGIQDPGNLGTLVRVAAAFGLDGVVALTGSVDPWNSKAVRAAAGACFRIPVVRAGPEEFVDWAGRREIPVLVAEADGEDVETRPAQRSWALVIGGEGEGAGDVVRAGAARRVSIPMPGGMESLNAGVAGAILLYALTRSATSV